MNSSDYYLNKQLVQYVSSCLELRDNVLLNYLIYYCYCLNAFAMLYPFYGHAKKLVVVVVLISTLRHVTHLDQLISIVVVMQHFFKIISLAS